MADSSHGGHGSPPICWHSPRHTPPPHHQPVVPPDGVTRSHATRVCYAVPHIQPLLHPHTLSHLRPASISAPRTLPVPRPAIHRLQGVPADTGTPKSCQVSYNLYNRLSARYISVSIYCCTGYQYLTAICILPAVSKLNMHPAIP